MEHKKIAKIEFNISLDENNIPDEIIWNATDSDVKNNKIKAVMISMWDDVTKESLKIDLWTKKMMAEEMKFFTVQAIDSLSDTYKRSTGDDVIADEIKKFALKIGKKLNVLK